MDSIVKHFIISGRVQGVGFRHFTYQTANELNIRGWVKNLQDGTVETVCVGSSDDLDMFKQKLKEGPPMARVEQIREVESKPDPGKFKDFTIRR